VCHTFFVARTLQPDTATAILDTAERLVQQRGFNGFSYADVAAELGVTKAGLHYHFAGKAELGEALMTRYAERFAEALAEIDARETSAPAKLKSYAALYGDVLNARRMCLCGMLAAEYETLPPRMQEVVLRFFDANERWLVGVLESGQQDGSLSFRQSPADAARLIVSALEGAMLVARPFADLGRFEAAADGLLKSFS
jgi:TetR/AcrR family transcriptional regulator, transcriptional repressor for nem operon